MSTRYFLFLFMVIALLVFADVDIATSENIQDILKSLQCSAQSMPGDEIRHFRVLEKKGKEAILSVDYSYNPAHGNQVYFGAYLLGTDGELLSLGFPPAAAPSVGSGTAIVMVNANNTESAQSTELFIWMYEAYKAEAFTCRRFPFVQYWAANMSVNEENQTITLRLKVPSGGYSLKIKEVYHIGNELWVISLITAPQESDFVTMSLTTLEDSIQIVAPKLPVRHFVIGKNWNWQNDEPYTFLKSPKEIEAQIKTGNRIYTR